MGRGASKARGGSGGGAQQKPQPQTQQQQDQTQDNSTQIQPVGDNVPSGAKAFTDAQAKALRQQEDAAYNANTKAAVKMYISNADFDNQGHSMSQTMNYLLDNGVDLANADLNSINRQFGLRLSSGDLASMQFTYSRMNSAFHPIGQSVKLQRGAHDDVLQLEFGIKNYANMSEAQLQKALVGKTFHNKSPMSTSYNVSKNPFLGNGPASGGREVVYNITAGAKTPMLFGAQKQSEVVLGYSHWKITGVHYSGKTATPRGRGSKPQIEIDIETL